MCDPVTLIGLAVGGIGSMMMAGQAMPDPPAAEVPAIPAPETPTEAPKVKLGTDEQDPADERRVTGAPKRSAVSLGNLGRSALTI